MVTSDREDLEQEYEMTFAATPGQAQVIVKRRHRGWSWFEGWQHWRGRVEIAVDVPRATAVSVRARIRATRLAARHVSATWDTATAIATG